MTPNHTLMPQPFWSVSHSQLNGWLCGEILEAYIAPNPVAIGYERPKPERKGEAETPEERLTRSISRSQKVVRQLTNTNKLYVLHTLTFAPAHPNYFKGEKKWNIVETEKTKDREHVLELWRKFARKMRKYEESKGRFFRYIAVIEKHTGKRAERDKTIKIDTYHVHFLSDKVFGKRLLQAKWMHGLCNYSDWSIGRKSQDLADTYDDKPPDNPGVYASKYLGKDMDSEFAGRKRYWASKSLERPERVGAEEIRALIYGKMPMWEKITERVVDDKTCRTHQMTYKVDREDIKKVKVLKLNVKQKRELKALKKQRCRIMEEWIANQKMDREDKRSQKTYGKDIRKDDNDAIKGLIGELVLPNEKASQRPG